MALHGGGIGTVIFKPSGAPGSPLPYGIAVPPFKVVPLLFQYLVGKPRFYSFNAHTAKVHITPIPLKDKKSGTRGLQPRII